MSGGFQIQLQPLAPPWAILFAAAGLAAAVYLYYARWGEGISPGRRTILAALRSAALSGVIFALLGPSATRERTQRREAGLAVLVDASASMAVRDAGENRREARFSAARRAFTDAAGHLAGRYDLKLYAFDAAAVFLGAPETARRAGRLLESVEASGDATALGDALLQAAPQSEGAAVLVLSDGASNSGAPLSSAARELASRGIEVYASAFGAAGGLNVTLERVMGPRLLLRGEPAAFFAEISTAGALTGPVRVVLSSEGETIASAEVDPARGARLARLDFTPRESGHRTYLVRAEPLPAEENTADNSIEHSVEVAAGKLKVLFVEETPRWEYRFLKNALLRDDRLDARLLLTSGDRELADAEHYLAVFPPTRRALFDFDVVVLGDVPVRSLVPGDLENLEAFVSEGGGGLLMIGGPRHNPRAYCGTILGELSPVENAGAPRESPSGFPLTLTDAGARNPALSLSAGEQKDFWKTLPAPHWVLNVEPRPGAVVLARSAGEGLPVIVEQRFGRGTVVFIGTDELWRWRRYAGDRYLYRLWVQLARCLGARRLGAGAGGGELVVASASYAQGETVEAAAYLETGLAMPLEVPAVDGFVEDASTARTPVVFSRAAEGGGLYRARFPTGAPGRYRLVVEGPQGLLSQAFSVSDKAVEDLDTEPDAAALAGLAAATGGRLLPPGEIRRLVELHPPKYRSVVCGRTRALWSSWLLLAAVVAALSLEWALRKRWGLA